MEDSEIEIRLEGEDIWRQMIVLLKPYFVKKVIASHVLIYFPDFRSVAGEILKLERTSHEDAASLLIDKLLEVNNQPTSFYRQFIDAVESAGFDKLVSTLLLEKAKDDKYFRELIMRHMTVLKEVKCISLLSHLLSEDVINKLDFEEIEILEKTDGNPRAMIELLLRLPRQNKKWMEKFVFALRMNNEEAALRELQPLIEFMKKQDTKKVIGTATKFSGGHELQDAVIFSQHTSAESGIGVETLAENCDATEVKQPAYGCMATEVKQLISHQRETELKQFAFDDGFSVDNNLMSRTQHEEEFTSVDRTKIYDRDDEQKDVYDLRSIVSSRSSYSDNGEDLTHEMNLKVVTSDVDLRFPSATSLPSQHESSRSFEKVLVPNMVFVCGFHPNTIKNEIVEHFGMIGDIQLDSKGNPKVHMRKDRNTGLSKGEALIEYAFEQTANFAIEIFDKMEFKGNVIHVKIAWKKIAIDATLIPEDPEDETEEPTVEAIPEELKLRSYQEELAEKAKQGRNCIIVAPTGSGKTHVAMEIIKHHVATVDRMAKKILFFVPTVALVEQQRKQFDKYLPHCKILGMSGDQEAKLPLSELVPLHDIIVMTPQILENALKEDDVESLSIFSLVIFDECHHTSKNHPYNMIMSHYIDEKLDTQHAIYKCLPQVVGLTASVGVGKSKTMDQAVTCILRLCANMDTREICTVRRNLEELIKHVNNPVENTTELNGRQDDPFYRTINRIMQHIEDGMKRSENTKEVICENSDFEKLLQAPADRGGDRYTQWMSRLQKPVASITLQETRRFYATCMKHLQIHNTALLINADCRTKDALDYIVKEFNPSKVDDLAKFQDNTDHWLEDLFNEKKALLDRVCDDPQYENPKLNHLKRIICEEYEKAPDSRGIIFCKTREMTVALVNWMNDTPELKIFCPHNLVGSNAPSSKAGMTQVKQEDVLTYFKHGNHKLIVATSVAEEGLDVQKCNIVIRYEHVTNQIARVQSRGRARADNAQYLVVAEKGRGSAEKEECNKIREKMMNKAIDLINELKSREKHSRIADYQKEAQVERKMAQQGKEINKILQSKRRTDEVHTLRCFKCDAFVARSTDIRKIEASHHVILDVTYQERIIVRPHPNPKKFEDLELTGKIFCAKCHTDWGMMAVYKSVRFPVVKVCNMIVINEKQQRQSYKKWKQVSFSVNTLTPDDLQRMMQDYKKASADCFEEVESYDDDDDDDLESTWSEYD